MKNNLKVSIVQSELIWQDIDANLSMFTRKLQHISDTHLIVLPEMFTTGFTMDVSGVAESMNGKAMLWLKQTASDLKCAVCGSFIAKEGEKVYNRHIWMRSDGTYDYYDKRHLFRMAGENNHYTAGERRVVVELHGWRILLQTCYDLRFPVFSRNRGDYDAVVYVANWPEVRCEPWIKLLDARALENQAYVIGVNRVGKDGNGIVYSGDSAVIHPKGNKLSSVKPHEDTIETVEISMEELQSFRAAFPVQLDADSFTLL